MQTSEIQGQKQVQSERKTIIRPTEANWVLTGAGPKQAKVKTRDFVTTGYMAGKRADSLATGECLKCCL